MQTLSTAFCRQRIPWFRQLLFGRQQRRACSRDSRPAARAGGGWSKSTRARHSPEPGRIRRNRQPASTRINEISDSNWLLRLHDTTRQWATFISLTTVQTAATNTTRKRVNHSYVPVTIGLVAQQPYHYNSTCFFIVFAWCRLIFVGHRRNSWELVWKRINTERATENFTNPSQPTTRCSAIAERPRFRVRYIFRQK